MTGLFEGSLYWPNLSSRTWTTLDQSPCVTKRRPLPASLTCMRSASKPGVHEGSRLSSSRQPGGRCWWPREWQGGHNHLTLEKQSDTKGFNALPWVWATAIGFDSRVIMRGGRLEVFSGWGLEEKRVGRRDRKVKRRRISLNGNLCGHLWTQAFLTFSTPCHLHATTVLNNFPLQKGHGEHAFKEQY